MSDSTKKLSLKRKSLSAVLWSGADLGIRQGLTLVVSIVLARLLEPEVFGTIALLYLFVGLSNTFINSGFSGALIQKNDATHTDECTVFWINLVMGILVAASLWFIAPWIASFFEMSILIPLIWVLCVSLFFNAFGSIHLTLLTKKLNFKTPMKIGFFASFISGVVAILLAIKGYGVWALAAQELARSIVTASLLWLLHQWRPKFKFSVASARNLFGFGGYLMLSGILDIAYTRIYTLFIGKIYGVRDLGFYNRADRTKQIPVELLSGVLSRVAFPIFSATYQDKEKLRRGVRLALRGMMLINIPLMLGLLVTAEHVISVIFGAKWLPSVPLLQVLCVAGIFWPLHVINLNVLKAQGHSNLFFRLEVIKKIIGTTVLLVGLYFGVMGIAWSQVAFGLISFILNAHYTERYLNYGTLQQVHDFLPTVIISIFVMGFVFFVGNTMNSATYFILSVQVVLGVATFLLLCHFLNLKAYRELLELVRQKADSKHQMII